MIFTAEVIDYLDLLDIVNEIYCDLKDRYNADNVLDFAAFYANGFIDEYDWQIVKMRAKLYEWVQNDVNKQEEESYANHIHGRNKQCNK